MGARYELSNPDRFWRVEYILRQHGVSANTRTERIKGPRPPEVVEAIIADIKLLNAATETQH